MQASIEAELTAELQQISGQITAYGPNNRFKLMLYNHIPRGTTASTLQSSKLQANPENGQYYQIDQALHAEAMSKNPDPAHLYPWQINSCKQLYDRARLDFATVELFQEELTRVEDKLRDVEGDLNGKTGERLKAVSETQSALLEKLCRARMKLEKLLDMRHSLIRDSGVELKIRAKLDEIQRRLELRNRLDRLTNIEITPRPQIQIPENQMENLLQVLKEQRTGLQTLKKIITNDMRKVQKIEEGMASLYKKS